jgi:hypothetical protein
MQSNREDQLERNFLQYRLDVVQRMRPGDYKTAAIAGIEHSLRFLERDNRMPDTIFSALVHASCHLH